MKVNREEVLEYLRELEEENGGYYGTDLSDLAENLGVTPRALKKIRSKWLREDAAFKGLHYCGQHKPTITFGEFLNIESRIISNPLEVRGHILSDINKERQESGKESLSKPTFYRVAQQTFLTQFDADSQYPWCTRKGIELPVTYSVPEEINARMVLLRRHKESYDLLLNIIQNLVNTLGDDIVFHTVDTDNFYRLIAGKTTWKNNF